MKNKQSYKGNATLFLSIILLMFIGCRNQSPVASIDQSDMNAEIEKVPSKVCEEWDENCTDPTFPPPGDGGDDIIFETDSFIYANIYVQGVGISSTNQPVEYLSVEVWLKWYSSLQGYSFREEYNTQEVAAAADNHNYYEGNWSVKATHKMRDGNVEETKDTYAYKKIY